ncbi:hypothetical protein L484_000269 [Morus notabilis]|uniref:Malectin-like domain-containing protein n=1 Tax=Morus notabilis TaxID=981085 RepID=W9SE51_9ROSA|nr:hypothetical protein L484_000269 [Morus notabilis]
MIRARFMYGNYDNKGQAPTFDLYLGVDFWGTIITQYAFVKVDREIVFFPNSDDHIDVCLVNTGYGIPFISVLELRPWHNETYVSETGALRLGSRYDLNPSVNQVLRLASLEFFLFFSFLFSKEVSFLIIILFRCINKYCTLLCASKFYKKKKGLYTLWVLLH